MSKTSRSKVPSTELAAAQSEELIEVFCPVKHYILINQNIVFDWTFLNCVFKVMRLREIYLTTTLSGLACLSGKENPEASNQNDSDIRIPQARQMHEEEEIYELRPFTVKTSTRTERLLTDVPIKTDILDRSLFESAGATELGQALELLNGARTESNCQNCGTTEIQLLGLPGNYNQILVDGLPLFTGVASVYGIDQVPTLFIARIDF